MPIETTPFDAADYLKGKDDLLGWLNLCAEEDGDDPRFLVDAIGVAARAHGNMSALSRATGITREGIYKALGESGNPSFATVIKLLNAIGFGIAFVPLKKKPAKKARAAAKSPARPAAKKRAAPKKKAAR